MPITTSFFVPKTAYVEAEEHLSELIRKRAGDPEKAVAALKAMAALATMVGHPHYADFEAEARKRLSSRDQEDCPFSLPLWLSAARYGLRTPTFWMRSGHLDVREH